jgi:CheY-like chemotaxis protein
MHRNGSLTNNLYELLLEFSVMKKNLQVLIAEDDPVSRKFLESSVKKWGFPIRSTSDGEETRQCLISDDRPQLAIVDWNMPKLDGIGVCKAVRERYSMSDVFILILTARTESEDLASALEAGANDYMTKPFDATELKARLSMGQRLVDATSMSTGSPVETGMTSAPNQEGCITPIFDPHELKFKCRLPAPLLRAWESNGRLQKVLLDRLQVCPQCRSLPTFRFGCSTCGSGCVTNDRMIHHFACAHVGEARDFDEDGELVCPKCRVRQLVVGADFEHLTGPYRCLECDWTAAELEHVAHCLGCGFRFPANQAVIEDLMGFQYQGVDFAKAINTDGEDLQLPERVITVN